MAKQTCSFCLEQDIVKFIEDFKKDNNLSSRSVALERLVLTFKFQNYFKTEQIEAIKENEVYEKKDTSKAKSSIDTMFEMME